MSKTRRTLSKVGLVVVAILFSVGLQALAASTIPLWTPPTAAAPNNNVAAPLNTSGKVQYKKGGLILNTGGALNGNGLIVQNGKVGIGTTNPTVKLDVNGSIKASGEVVGTLSSGYGQFRAVPVSGRPSFFIRNDGNNTNFLLTNSNNQYGKWNNLRPLSINDTTGNVYVKTLCLSGKCESDWSSSGGPKLVTYANFISTYGGHTASDPKTRSLKYYVDMSGNLWRNPRPSGSPSGSEIIWGQRVCNLLHNGWCAYADDFWPTQNGISVTHGGSTDTRFFTIWDSPTRVSNCRYAVTRFYWGGRWWQWQDTSSLICEAHS